MRKISFSLSGLFLVISVLAQSPCTREVNGFIKDIETGEPLPFATVKIVDTDLGAITEENGAFTITNICSDEIHISVSFTGYKTATHHHDFHHTSPTIFLAQDQIELESVVIEEKRNPRQINSLSAITYQPKEFEALGSTAGDLLSSVSGVSTLKSGQNIVKPMVHGLHSNRVLLINNGVRHSYQAWGQEHAPEVDPTQIDKLTLVKGAATVRYGPEALGGVIILNAEEPAYDKPLYGKVGTGFQSNGRAFSGLLDVGQGSHRFAWNAGAYSVIQGDLRAPDYSLTNTSKRETGYHFFSRLHRPKYDLDLYVSSFRQELGILRGSVTGSVEDLVEAMNSPIPEVTKPFSYDINNPRQETQHDLYKLKNTFFLGEHELAFQYAFQQNLRKEFDIRRGTNNEIPSINLKLQTHSLDIDWDYPDGMLKGVVGAQFFYQDNNNIPGTNTIPFIPNYNVTNFGLFTVQSIERTDITYELGLRYDYQRIDARGRDHRNNLYRNELNYNNFTFSLGLTKKMSQTVTLRTNLGSAWRPPKVGELYSFGKHQFNFQYGLWRYELFNENDSISARNVLDNSSKPVKSEQGIKWISGIELDKKNFQLELVPYVNYIQNFFYTRPFGITNTVRGPFPFFIYDQTDALFLGADLDVRMQHDESLSSEAKISFVHAEDVINNEAFIEIPPLNLNYSLQKKLNNLTFILTTVWTAQQWNTPPTIRPEVFLEPDVELDRSGTFDLADAPEGYLLLHATLIYSKNKFIGSAKVTNFLNKSYRVYTDRLRYFSDDIGRNLSISLSYRLSK